MYPRTHALAHPDKPAVVMETGESVSYCELEERSNRLARLLRARGLRPGDQVSIWAENHPRYYEVYWAAMRSGLYVTGINRHATPEEAAYILTDSDTRALITSAAMAERAAGVRDRAPGCTTWLAFDGPVAGFESYKDALAGESGEPLPEEPRGEVMLYSSGTTGRPKGIRRPLSGLRVDDPAATRTSAITGPLLGMGADSVYLMPAPLYHAAALQFSVATQELGGTVVVMATFDAERFLRLVDEHRVTHTQVVPTMMVRMLKLPEEVRLRHDTSSLRSFLHAAAPCPPEIKRLAIEWLGPIVDEYYGGSEGNGMTFIDSERWLAHPGSVGRPVLGTIHICDEAGRELPVGEPGVVYFERDKTPFEYHNAEEKTRGSRHPEHPTWSAIGDLGYLDDEGFLYLTDRLAFTIISGGVNIYPAEIEACLVVHPDVADVVVFGLPDEEMGEYVHAVVEPADPAAAGPALAQALRDHVREHLAGFKVPRVVEFRDVPRLATGKVQTRLLRQEHLDRAAAPA
ncbi:AMP-binding protein [Nocardioides sp. dk4132]|uniref:acyl-CoA synthetase n=1 Tax=unclassified Nocardioides TaxID=2615069 RepID=UPI00129577B2|nr:MULTISPECIES: acyl-CoA synthetase [unclassified Nocardioides]MQW76194.1 AMP-binding protein [Nocardioides sp. dk4132]QGA09022.1 AMP-binding protein [Nocardioides sp. dk884]